MNLEVLTATHESKTHRAPLLFIHGMWHAAWCWAENFLPYFSDNGYDCYALSLRGHGNSEGHEKIRWHSLNDYVTDVTQVLAQLPSSPILIGHSMGGMILQKYLETNTSPAAILLASAPPNGVLSATIRSLFRHPLPVIKSSLTLSMSPMVSTSQLAQDSFFSTDMDSAKMLKYFSQLQDESFRAYLDMLALSLPHLKKVETPLLVLGAENDMMISQHEVEATAKAYGTEAKIFSDMAHDMMLEENWKDVADYMLSWLDKKHMTNS